MIYTHNATITTLKMHIIRTPNKLSGNNSFTKYDTIKEAIVTTTHGKITALIKLRSDSLIRDLIIISLAVKAIMQIDRWTI